MSQLPETSVSNPGTVDAYVAEFQRRFHDFEAARQEELRQMKHDFIARLFSDHVVLGDKPTYDCMLQGMLKDAERDKLETDPGFTKAWRIFVDLCWMKKQLARAALIVAGIILALVAAALLLYALLYVAKPSTR
ncbi:MAG TPA: hypothetical protein VMP11_11530 [Verrucomicrobiae bacterium]|nr:hypothetical protein [Verrucomicrobiae bacterium]